MIIDVELSKARNRLQMLCETTAGIRSPWISEMYVHEYESILRCLQDAGVDVVGFEVPDSATRASFDERTCDRDFFIMKLSGLILHLATVAPGASGADLALAKRLRLEFQTSDDEDPPF